MANTAARSAGPSSVGSARSTLRSVSSHRSSELRAHTRLPTSATHSAAGRGRARRKNEPVL